MNLKKVRFRRFRYCWAPLPNYLFEATRPYFQRRNHNRKKI